MAVAGGHEHFPDRAGFKRLFKALLAPEASYYRVILVFSAAISLLTLVLPISVQLLIDTIANVGRVSAVVTIGLMMLGLLVLSGVLYALRAWTMELFNRHLFTRLGSEIALTGVLAQTGYFDHEDRASLFNRYFDIMTLKKNMPYLLSYGFTLFFQTVIGFIAVSLYHFYFFIFSLCFLLLAYLIWASTGWKAISSAFVLSELKHSTAYWLQGLAVNNGFFKGRQRLAFALAHTNERIHQHLDAQETHFSYSFSQLISFLALYALASAALLTMGGWLVIQGQLTLGQLVAAELILSSIFYGLPQLAGVLEYYYDVCAASEELSRFSAVNIEQWQDRGPVVFIPGSALGLHKVACEVNGTAMQMSLQLPPRAIVRGTGSVGLMQDTLNGILKRSVVPLSGSVTWGEQDLGDCPLQDVRDLVTVLDRQTLLPMTIRQYLALSATEVSSHQIQQVLELLELTEDIARLPQGMDTLLSHTGQPLVLDQALRLKLAFTLLSSSRLLLLTQIFDCIDAAPLLCALNYFSAEKQGIVIYYTRRQDLSCFTHVLTLEPTRQRVSAV